jgi:hypothetical protein
MYCTACGSPKSEAADFCYACGQRILRPGSSARSQGVPSRTLETSPNGNVESESTAPPVPLGDRRLEPNLENDHPTALRADAVSHATTGSGQDAPRAAAGAVAEGKCSVHVSLVEVQKSSRAQPVRVVAIILLTVFGLFAFASLVAGKLDAVAVHLGLGALVYIFGLRGQRRISVDADQSSAFGVRGWLVVVCFTIFPLFPFWVLLTAADGFRKLASDFTQFPAVKTVVTVEFVLAVVMAIFSSVTGLALWTRHRMALSLTQAFLPVFLVYALVEPCLMFFAGYPPEATKTIIRDAVVYGCRPFLFLLPWFFYFRYVGGREDLSISDHCRTSLIRACG